jgi:hypothetical protein
LAEVSKYGMLPLAWHQVMARFCDTCGRMRAVRDKASMEIKRRKRDRREERTHSSAPPH